MTTQFADDTDTATQGGGRGRLSRIIGPVVDVEFPADAMPELYNLLYTEVDLSGEGAEFEGKKRINLEVAQHIGDNLVRAISLQPTDGLVRGAAVIDTLDGAGRPGPDRYLSPEIESVVARVAGGDVLAAATRAAGDFN